MQIKACECYESKVLYLSKMKEESELEQKPQIDSQMLVIGATEKAWQFTITIFEQRLNFDKTQQSIDQTFYGNE